MNTPTLSKCLGIVTLLSACGFANAGYSLYGRAYSNVFFSGEQNFLIDQANGVKRYTQEAKVQSPDDLAIGRVDVQFGRHRGYCFAEGFFSNSYVEARTFDDLTFTNPNGGAVTVQINLIGGGTIIKPGSISLMSATSTLSINGDVRVFYRDEYQGSTHNVNTPAPYTFVVPSGGTIQLGHKSIFRISGTGTAQPYIVSFNDGFQPEVRVMTVGAGMRSSTGNRYVPLLPLMSRP